MTAATQVIPTGTLKQLKLSDITVGERFRKDFSDDQTFIDSVRDKGIIQPITVDRELNLLAGERRYRAAQAVGLEKIPALVRQVEDEIDSREIELIENTFRKDFTWQERVAIVAEIDRLYKAKDMDWSGRKTAQLLDKGVMTVQRDLELARAIVSIPELGEQATASDAYKMLKKFEETVAIDELRRRQQTAMDYDPSLIIDDGAEDDPDATAPSGRPLYEYSPDLKQRLKIAYADYKIGDTFKGLAEMRSESMVALIECDPPYGIDLGAVKGSKDSVDSTVQGYEEIPADKYGDFLDNLTKELYRVAAKDCWLVFWFGPTWHHQVATSLRVAGWHVDDIPAIWVKTQGQTLQPEIYLARGYEPFFLCRKGSPYMAKRGRLNVFQYPGTPSAQKYHPTERPLPLIKEILSTIGVARQFVLVPFLGSGATLRVAYKLGMLATGWDLNPTYKDRFMLAVEEDFKQTETTQEQTT